MEKSRFIALVKAAGVVGEGGAGFPAHVKYDACVDTVIANGCECEPLLHTDQHHMMHHAPDIVRALSALVEVTGASRGVIALKRKHAEIVDHLSRATAGTGLSLALIDNFYPAGDEQVLVKEVTGRTVPPLGLPLAVGVAVANTGTLVSVSRAMDETPVTRKVVTVTGEVKTPCLVEAPLGTPVSALVAACGGEIVPDPVYVLGGPMMGPVVDTPEAYAAAVVTKTTGGVIVLPRGHFLQVNARTTPEAMRRRAAAACIQCRYCSELCPRYLIGQPFETHRVMRAFAAGVEGSSQPARQALLCCECGVCELYACPMGLSPRRINIEVKRAMRAAGQKYEGSREVTGTRDDWRSYRRIPVPRLAARVGIERYMGIHPAGCLEVRPKAVRIPLRQHIGAPAAAVVAPGETVVAGQVIGEIPEGALGARVHASIDGVVTGVDGAVSISSKGALR